MFSGVFFSPQGDLLDIPSDGDESLNLTLSSTSISDGAAHPQFAQFAVLGGNTDGSIATGGDGGGDGSGVGQEGVGPLNPARESSHHLQDLLTTAAVPSSGSGGTVGMETDEASATAAAAVGSSPAPLLAAAQVPGFPPQVPVGGVGGTEAAAVAAAAEAAAAAEQARAAHEMAVSKAEEAVKAAAAHAEVGW